MTDTYTAEQATATTTPTGDEVASDPTAVLRRPSGAFAMLAVDQREALRLMFAGDAAPEADGSVPEAVLKAVPDATLTEFKLQVTRELGPHASAVLLDTEFVWDQAVSEGLVGSLAAPILSADHFIAGHGEAVTAVEIDETIDFARAAEQGAVALKLLVIHRPDEPAAGRVGMVTDFVARCRAAGLVSIIEPVCKAPRHGGPWDWDRAVVDAAQELGNLGADLYKGEVPLKGQGSDEELLAACRQLDAEIGSPWVVLSSGVSPDDFPRAVRIACQAGASGFLAGRAVWRHCVAAEDLTTALREDALPRLQRLIAVADEAVSAQSHR